MNTGLALETRQPPAWRQTVPWAEKKRHNESGISSGDSLCLQLAGLLSILLDKAIHMFKLFLSRSSATCHQGTFGEMA